MFPLKYIIMSGKGHFQTTVCHAVRVYINSEESELPKTVIIWFKCSITFNLDLIQYESTSFTFSKKYYTNWRNVDGFFAQ